MRPAIEQFIRYLATERGLSDNYQLSVRRSLEKFALWLHAQGIDDPAAVTIQLITDYLGTRKRARLAAGSIKLELVAIKIFLRYLHVARLVPTDVGETLTLPRIERYLPETLNELQVERLLAAMPDPPPGDWLGLRDRAQAVVVAYETGLVVPRPTDASSGSAASP